MKKNAAIYCHVSMKDQARERYLLGEQLETKRFMI